MPKLNYADARTILFELPKRSMCSLDIAVSIEYLELNDNMIRAYVWAQHSFETPDGIISPTRIMVHVEPDFALPRNANPESCIIAKVMKNKEFQHEMAHFVLGVCTAEKPELCSTFEKTNETYNKLRRSLERYGASLPGIPTDDPITDMPEISDEEAAEMLLNSLPPEMSKLVSEALESGAATLTSSPGFQNNDSCVLYSLLSQYRQSHRQIYGVNALAEQFSDDPCADHKNKAVPAKQRVLAAAEEIQKKCPEFHLSFEFLHWNMEEPGEDLIQFVLYGDTKADVHTTPTLLHGAHFFRFRVPIMATKGHDIDCHLELKHANNDTMVYIAYVSKPDHGDDLHFAECGSIELAPGFTPEIMEQYLGKIILTLSQSHKFQCAICKLVNGRSCEECHESIPTGKMPVS